MDVDQKERLAVAQRFARVIYGEDWEEMTQHRRNLWLAVLDDIVDAMTYSGAVRRKLIEHALEPLNKDDEATS